MHDRCCFRSALDLTRAFCGDCGGPLLRCAAFEECGGLVDTDGRCPVCIAPELVLGGAQTASVGGSLALPLSIRNRTKLSRPLFLHGVHVREGGGAWRSVDVAWERLDAGATAPLPVVTNAFERAGSQRVDVALALATRWRWREEVFCFTAGFDVDVEAGRSVTVQQNITYAGGDGVAGGTVYAPFRFEGGSEAASARARVQEAPVELVRAARLERALGLRGYGDEEPAVPRGVRFHWSGFAAGDAPGAVGPITTSDGTLALGRARSRMQAGGTNDARLLARDASGGIDETASLAISRRHLSLWIENDRLMVRAEAPGGAAVGRDPLGQGEPLSQGQQRALRSGDVVAALPGHAHGTSFRVQFDAHHGVTHTVHVIGL